MANIWLENLQRYRQLAEAQRAYEPFRQNHWMLLIDLGDLGDASVGESLSLACVSAAPPTYTIEESQVETPMYPIYYAGRVTFDTLSVTYVDYTEPPIWMFLERWMRKAYNPQTNTPGLARDYWKNAVLYDFSPDGSVRREWKIFGLWPTAVQNGQREKSSGEQLTLEVTFRYNYAYVVLS